MHLLKNSFFTTYLEVQTLKNDVLKHTLNFAAKNYLKTFYLASNADI